MLPSKSLRIALILAISAIFVSAQTTIEELRKRAEAGDPKAQNELGVAYRLGEGVPKDKVEAVAWYRKSAFQRYPDGIFNLGISYYNGDGVAIDELRAYAWLYIAKEEGSAEAGPAIEQFTSDWRPSKLATARMIAFEIYTEGKEFPRDDQRALTIVKEGAEGGDPDSQYALCVLYAKGIAVQRNDEEAFNWCEKAAKRKQFRALLAVGEMYEMGTGIKQDYKQALYWYELAAIDNPQAAYRIAHFYKDGVIETSNKLLQPAWLMWAESKGIKPAKEELDPILQKMDKGSLAKLQSLVYQLQFDSRRRLQSEKP